MRKANLSFLGTKNNSTARDSLPSDVRRPQRSHVSTDTTTRTMLQENETGLAQLVDECEKFMSKIKMEKDSRHDLDMQAAEDDSHSEGEEDGDEDSEVTESENM